MYYIVLDGFKFNHIIRMYNIIPLLTIFFIIYTYIKNHIDRLLRINYDQWSA